MREMRADMQRSFLADETLKAGATGIAGIANAVGEAATGAGEPAPEETSERTSSPGGVASLAPCSRESACFRAD